MSLLWANAAFSPPVEQMSVEDVLALKSHDHPGKVGGTLRHLQRDWDRYNAGVGESQRSSYHQHGGPQGYLDHLTEQVSRNGITEPLIISQHPSGHREQLWDGHHRALVAGPAGLTHLPVVRVPSHMLMNGEYP